MVKDDLEFDNTAIHKIFPYSYRMEKDFFLMTSLHSLMLLVKLLIELS